MSRTRTAGPGERPYVLLDVDGVINLARFRSARERGRLTSRDKMRAAGCEPWFHRRPDDPFTDDRLLVNLPVVRPLVQALADSGAELAWATTWGSRANDVFSPLLGLPDLPVAPVSPRLSRKAWTVIPWTQGRPWAWLEDQQPELEAALAVAERGVPCQPVLVDRAAGLDAGYTAQVLRWLESL